MKRDTPHVIITDASADQAGRVLGMRREQARAWLRQAVPGGEITDRLPPPFTGMRSPSGHFLLLPGTLVLPLVRAADRWKATACTFFPGWLREKGLGGVAVDPFALHGADLIAQVRFTAHAVHRFQRRAAGHPDPDLAVAELRRMLSRDARAVRHRPGWHRSRSRADFFLVGADDECCLPMRINTSNGSPFEALTFLHRSMRLFDLSSAELAAACRFPQDVLAQAADLMGGEPGGRPAAWLNTRIGTSGVLSWHPPAGHSAHPRARFYVHAGGVFLPVGWDKRGQARRPLVALSVHRTRLPLRARLIAWLRRRFVLRVG